MNKNKAISISIISILFIQFLFGVPPIWEDDPGVYEFTALMNAQVLLDGIPIADCVVVGDYNICDDVGGDMLAAFDVEGNIRGTGIAILGIENYQGQVIFEIMLRSNSEGDEIIFKYYDASNDSVLDINESYEFIINAVIGNLMDPHTLNLDFETEGCVDADEILAPFDCTAVINNWGCEYIWDEMIISEICPLSCGICEGNDIEGCVDLIACNYNADATVDDGSCVFAEEYYDCDGNCLFAIDGCGVCDNDPSNDCGQDCSGEWGGGLTEDECGVCDGSGPEEGLDCDGTPLEFVYNQSTIQAFYNFTSIKDIYGNELIAEDWVAAFNGDICVGSRQWDASLCLSGICDVPVMGDDSYPGTSTDGYLNIGEEPSFRIYDASEGEYFNVTPSDNFGFENLGIFVIEELMITVSYNIMLQQHANLISFYALPENSSIVLLMEDIIPNLTTVIGEATSALYNGEYWMGSLAYLDMSSGYWLTLTNADSLTGSGFPYNINHIYDLHAGPNLVSFPSYGSFNIPGALPDNIEGNIMLVLGEGMAAFHSDNGWYGSLTQFEGLHGYWLVTDADISFSYELDLDNMLPRNSNQYEHSEIPDGFIYNQSSEQCFYFVGNIELSNGVIETGDWLISYNGAVLTGMRKWIGKMIDIPAMGNTGNHFTEGYFEEGDMPTFKLLQHSTGKLIKLGGEIPVWTANNAYVISGLTEMQPLPETFELQNAYPNPFNPITTISFALPEETNVKLKVYDVNGRIITKLYDNIMKSGYHSVTWNADSYSSGVYFVTMTAGQFISTNKLILMK